MYVCVYTYIYTCIYIYAYVFPVAEVLSKRPSMCHE